MNGCVVKDTPIAVDIWKTRDNPSAKLFFLTHLHGDHVVGLTSSWQHNIYCSEITAKLLLKNYGIKEDLVKPLSIGQNHILYLDEEQLEQMVVTLLDANHCPGAVMFLFEGYFGKILYTGDFRYYDDFFIENSEQLVNIDTVYLDNTYCEEGCEFQSVESATEEIFSIIREHPDHDVIIGLRNLGKEELLLKIALEFKEWISIPVKMSYTIDVLGYPDVFKVDDKTCRIRTVPLYTISKNYIEKLNKSIKTIAIIPTGLYSGLGFEPFSNSENIHVVNYSNHSSFNELRNFVQLLAPKHVIPIVNGKSRGPFGMSFENRADMSCFDSFLSHKPRLNFTIPDSVKRMMTTRLTMNTSKNVNQTQKRKKPLLVKKSSKLVSKGVMFEDDLNEQWESKRKKIEDPEVLSYIEPASVESLNIGSGESDDDIFNDSDGVGSSELHIEFGDTGINDESVEHSKVKLGMYSPRSQDKQLDSHRQDIHSTCTERAINCKEYNGVTCKQHGKEEYIDDNDAVCTIVNSYSDIESCEIVNKDVGQKTLNNGDEEKQNTDKHQGSTETKQQNSDETTELTGKGSASVAKLSADNEVNLCVSERVDINQADGRRREEIDYIKDCQITWCCNQKMYLDRQNCGREVVNRATKMCSTLCDDGNLSNETETRKPGEHESFSCKEDKPKLVDISINVIPNLNKKLSPSLKRQKLYNVFNKFLDF